MVLLHHQTSNIHLSGVFQCSLCKLNMYFICLVIFIYMKCCDKFVFFSSCLGLLKTKSSFFDGFKYLCWPCPAVIYRLPNQKSCNRNIPNVHSKHISRLRSDSSSDSCDSNAFRSVAIDNNIWRVWIVIVHKNDMFICT